MFVQKHLIPHGRSRRQGGGTASINDEDREEEQWKRGMGLVQV